MLKITVYSLPASVCISCRATELSLRMKGIEVEKVRVDQDADAMAYIKSLGYSAAPVIVVTNGEDVVDSWSGFSETRMESLKELVAA